MTMFWWARALKVSHLNQARGLLNAYAKDESTGRAELEIAFGHMRAILDVELCVEVAVGTLRAQYQQDLIHAIPEAIGQIIELWDTWVSREGVPDEQLKDIRLAPLAVLDLLEEKHTNIIYS